MNFTKMQGAGNDFIVIESNEDRDWSRLAKVICNRHFGVGGDGLLLVSPSDKADVRMREFNLDGSEAEACGNGLRCVVKYAVHSGFAEADAGQISVETIAGIRQAKLYKTEGKETRIQVSMGKPKFEAKDIPVIIEPSDGRGVDITSVIDYSLVIENRELLLGFVSMGNPHAVCFWQYPVEDFPLSQLGPLVEQHDIFPNRINFEVARIINQKQIEARVWERGVGETLACGSGACAVTVIAQLHGYIGNRVAIKLPGGTLDVEWDRMGEVLLSGSAEVVFTGEWTGEV